MMLRESLAALCFVSILGALSYAIPAASAESSQPSTQWQSGVHYTVLSPTQPTDAKPGRVVVTEFFWLGCKHCYALEAPLAEWLKNRPDYIDFKRVHVAWGAAQEPAHARLYYTLQQLEREDVVSKAFAELQKDDKNPIEKRNPLYVQDDGAETFRLQREFAVANGVSMEDFTKAYNSAVVRSKVDASKKLAAEVKLQGVPTIIVAGKYSTGVYPAGGPEKLFNLVDYLASQEIARTANR